MICLRYILVLALAAPALADEGSPQRLGEEKDRQQSLQVRARQIGEEINGIIDEFDRNRLSDSPELRTLRSVRAILSTCSADEMDKVLELLKAARAAQDPADSRRYVSSAYARQKSILAQLQQLLIEYRRQQGVEELASRFTQLAQRQAANLKATIDLTKLTAQRPRDQYRYRPARVRREEAPALREVSADGRPEQRLHRYRDRVERHHVGHGQREVHHKPQ